MRRNQTDTIVFFADQKYSEGNEGCMSIISKKDDINHQMAKSGGIVLRVNASRMIFSKSFGYALRGVFYVALMNDEKRKVQLDEIAQKLSVPRHFLGKIMNIMVKEGILSSTKGPYGGFSLNENTLKIPLMKIIEVTHDFDQFQDCALRLRK